MTSVGFVRVLGAALARDLPFAAELSDRHAFLSGQCKRRHLDGMTTGLEFLKGGAHPFAHFADVDPVQYGDQRLSLFEFAMEFDQLTLTPLQRAA